MTHKRIRSYHQNYSQANTPVIERFSQAIVEDALVLVDTQRGNTTYRYTYITPADWEETDILKFEKELDTIVEKSIERPQRIINRAVGQI